MGNSLIYGDKVSAGFRKEVKRIAKGLEMPDEGANWLMACMYVETGGDFDPKHVSSKTNGTGLLRFTPEVAEKLGTTTKKLSDMKAEEQLKYVELYFKDYIGKFKSLSDVYMAILYPKAVGKSEDYVLGGTNQNSVSKIYNINKKYDKNGDQQIQKSEAASVVQARYDEGLAALKASSKGTKKSDTQNQTIIAGSKVIVTGTKYINGQSIPSFVQGQEYTVSEVSNGSALLKEIYSRVPLDGLKLKSGGGTAATPTNATPVSTNNSNGAVTATQQTTAPQTTTGKTNGGAGNNTFSGDVKQLGILTSDGVIRRKGPGKNYGSYENKYYYYGEIVEILGHENSFYKVRYGEKGVSYVADWFVHTINISKSDTKGAISDDGVPLNNQRAYSNTLMNNDATKKETIAQVGCTMSSIAMCISKIKGITLRPDTFDSLLDMKDGYYDDTNGIGWDNTNKAINSKYGGGCVKCKISKEIIDSQLAAGCPSVISVTTANGVGHWVCVAGRDKDGNYIIHDPWSSNDKINDIDGGKISIGRWTGTNMLVDGCKYGNGSMVVVW